MPEPRVVLVVVPDHAQLLDVAGPVQVFTHAAELGAGYRVLCVDGGVGEPTHQGPRLAADPDWPVLTAGDLVVVPGWKVQRGPGFRADVLERVVSHTDAGGRVASVCAGALALARLGLLDGRRATTHHDLVDVLARRRAVDVVRDVLYTCDGPVHTSAGIASGIDLSLHLVAHDHGPAVAARVARTMVVPAWRRGAAPQQSVMLLHRDHLDDVVHRAQEVLDDADVAPEPLATIAARLGVSPRTLRRRFLAATGMTPAAYRSAVRLERAEQLHAQGWTWQAAAEAVGYVDARSLRGGRA